ncbi:MAG: sugar phosphate nucleotidyltransferase [bacterium]
MARIHAQDLVAVILAGGAGTRFWPLSTEQKPKQFLRILDERSLLRMSLERLEGMVPVHRTLVLTKAEMIPLVVRDLPELPQRNILGEPLRRDTAAAVCLAALVCKRLFGEAVMAVLTADHLIWPVNEFQDSLASAVRAARSSKALYTFGIPPTHPATGYGYLELGEELQRDGHVRHHRILRFREKPDLETAKTYLQSGRFMWNSGMFVWSVQTILEEIKRHLPVHFQELSKAMEHWDTPQWPDALSRAFSFLDTVSVDYGVMEKATEIRCVVGTWQWKDVGGWPSIMELLPKDDKGNAVRGKLFSENSARNLVFCEDPQEKVALLGVEGLVVARAGKKTLVARMEEAERLKALVQRFKQDLEEP